MPRETQKSIHDWMMATFPGADPASPRKALRFLEEAVELCLAAGATIQEIDQAAFTVIDKAGAAGQEYDERRPKPEEVPEESGDCAIILKGFAEMKGFDLDEQVDEKMTTNRGRTWAVRGDGTGYHT